MKLSEMDDIIKSITLRPINLIISYDVEVVHYTIRTINLIV